ncbi:MAG TPA: hypothetical protein VFJ13_01385 [Paracoccaceae bacterium]|nr:hypothetical protein [Paracoccaceae bacterium]
MDYEYKCVGAPERPKRQRGVRGRSERVALAMQEIIAAEVVDGWEYMRTDLVPVEEKNGFFSRTHEVHRAVLIFRREMEPAPRLIPARRPHAIAAEPDPSPQPERGPEARGESRGEGRIPLSADRDEPAPPAHGNRPPPKGLG